MAIACVGLIALGCLLTLKSTWKVFFPHASINVKGPNGEKEKIKFSSFSLVISNILYFFITLSYILHGVLGLLALKSNTVGRFKKFYF